MGATLAIQFVGLDALVRELRRENRKRPGAMKRRGLEAGRLVQKAMKANVRKRSGKTARAITLTVKERPGLTTQVDVEIGPDNRRGGQAGHLIERGTVPRRQESTGRFTGEMPERPFVALAVQQTSRQVEDLLGRALKVV